MAEPYLDAVQISAGVDIGIQGNVHMATTTFAEHMPNVGWAAEVRKSVSIPVAVVGAVMHPDEAEAALARGDVDLVALGRPLIADPDWPRKAQEGRAGDIVPCIRCLQCYHISTERKNVGCSVNARFWNESFVPRALTPAVARKHMVVVGGGPAGIQAALTADRRGHRVTLLERDDALGGQLRWVAKERYKQDIAAYLAYLLRQVAASGIDVRTGVDATPGTVEALAPDSLVVAVGADEVRPPIQGADLPHVYTGCGAIDREAELGRRVVIIGAGQIGTEIGLELAVLRGAQVSLVETGETYAGQGNTLYREGLRQELEKAEDLTFLFRTTCHRITPDGVVVAGPDGHEQLLPADSVVISVGMRSRAVEHYYGITPETVTVGDAVRPRIIMDAVFEGYTYAMNL
jgi:NADPH-dependent 2,4-dienoyl-CoA reductase/sulfur reductase-like enzyme